MSSLYDELCEKVKMNPKVSRPGVAKFDLSLLLFNERESLHELWQAADRLCQSADSATLSELHVSVDKLRPIFGERGEVTRRK